jgi:hypothetical protein
MKAHGGHSFASRLAFDLAVSRVSLAAIKAKAHVYLSEEDLRSAAQLRDAFKEQLAEEGGGTHIPEELVPRDDMRHQLEEALGTLTSVTRTLPVQDPGLLSRLVASLDLLIEGGSLPEGEAASLLDGLLHLGIRPSEMPNAKEVDSVYVDALA